MQRLFKLLFFSLILSHQGCQTLSQYSVFPETQEKFMDQEQVYGLLMQGMQYQKLNKRQQRAKCKKLRQDYQNQTNWQTAWLLVYSLNADFSCVNLDKALGLLNDIQHTPGVDSQLLWLNKNQIQLLNNLQKKNNSLQNQLNETEIQLQQVISKIQALKAIETSINKKLDDENTNEK